MAVPPTLTGRRLFRDSRLFRLLLGFGCSEKHLGGSPHTGSPYPYTIAVWLPGYDTAPRISKLPPWPNLEPGRKEYSALVMTRRRTAPSTRRY